MGTETDHRFSSGEGGWSGLRPAAFVGRAVELGMFDAALERAVRFRAPQFVTAVGSLGAGKTRLWAEWLAEVASPGVRIARVALSAPGSAQSRGNLVGSLLRQRFGIAPHFSAEAALVQFRSEIRRVFADRHVAEVAALLGRFLGFELRESPLSQAISGAPGQGRELARAVLCRFLEQDARDAPLVLAVDDLHLADEESLEILERIPAELGPSSLVLLATARQDLMLRRPQWGSAGSRSIRIDLAPLGQDAVGAMIRSVLDVEGDEALPAALVERVTSESRGNPYLVEQLLHVYRRHEVLLPHGERGWWFDAESDGAAAIPLGPEAVARARVESLSPIERAVLARAATFGQVFWTGGVVALGRVSTEPSDPVSVFGPDQSILDLRDILEDLGRRDFLQRASESSLPGDAEWVFRHAGDVDLILAAVDPTALAQMRRFAAQWLESRGGAGREARFEMLGRLYEDGGDSRRAAYCFLSAAEDAGQRAEAERARSLYLRAVRLLETDDAVAKMDALYALGDLAARLGRTREALVHFGEMLVISWRLDLPSKGGAAHGRIARLQATLGEHQAALGHLDVARALFEAAGDLAGIASTLDDMGRVHLLNGAPEMSLEFHRAAFQVRDQIGDDRGKGLALARMGQVEHETGDLIAAEGHVRQAIELRRRAGDRQGMVASLLELGALERDLGRVERAMAILDEAWALARDLGERLYECSIAIALGDCWLTQARPTEARPFFVEAKEIARQFGAKALLAEASRGLAEVELAAGAGLEARDEARAAFELADAIGAAPLAGAALRVMATAVGLGTPGDSDLGGAREMFDRAVDLLTNAASELELGRTLAAYADFEARAGRKSVARELRRQADLIRTKTRAPSTAPAERPRPSRSLSAGPLLSELAEVGS